MTTTMAAFTVFVIAAVVYSLLQSGHLRFNNPSPEGFPVRGIDVSHHQGVIDWPLLKAQGIQFAFIKATEGADHVDRKFLINWNASRAAGIARGAYHFFTFCRSGKEQARNFMRVVPDDPNALPMALDLEFGGNCNREMSEVELAREIADFILEAKKVFSAKPIFYTTPEFFDRYLKQHAHLFPEHTLWLRNVFSEPRQGDCEEWGFWQFANRGRLDGISGPVDLNVYCGSIGRFIATFGGKT